MASREQVVVFGGLTLLLVTVLWWMNSPDETAPIKKAPRHAIAAVVVDEDESAVSDYSGPAFPKPYGKLRDVFLPVNIGVDGDKTKSNKLEKIPAGLAGDGNWIFTGIAQVNGLTEALLENSTKHEYGFVHEGQAWKRCHVGQITSDKVSLLGAEGVETVVFRFNPLDQNKGQTASEEAAKPNPDQADVAPVQPHPNLRGPIGMPMQVDAEAAAGG
jgi:hypothetical protein